MKKIICLLLLLVSMTATAQDVTKFLGIPIDGYKPEMKKALIAKGFVYKSEYDFFEGEFNGYDVNLSIVTNNNKVYRLMLIDKNSCNEGDIIIRFNKLCRQFERNIKYVRLSDEEYTIPEDEDLSYEMNIHNKRYEASYRQIPDSTKYDEKKMLEHAKREMDYSDADLDSIGKDVVVGVLRKVLYYDNLLKNSVWFMIDEKYGKYRIVMYYDNNYNKADGEDL